MHSERATFKLKTFLGEGLSSRVFSAVREDSRGFSRQEVVLKILKNENDVSWLKHEFSVLTQLKSPHCVSIFGWENLPDGPALVLEKIDGVTLLELARLRRLTPDEVEEVIRQAQEGLLALHRAGLHHGDLSPANLMVDRMGTVQLIDFALIPRERLAGTPPYICPERWSGTANEIHSDLFSLGLIRFDLLNGVENIPTDISACRKRAANLAGSGCSLLEKNGDMRAMRLITENQLARGALAAKVSEILLERLAHCSKTVLLEKTAAKKLRHHFGMRSPVILSSLLCMVLAFTPTTSGVNNVHGQNSSGFQAEITVRSMNWLHLRLDGQDYGYAPKVIAITRAGPHQLQWQTADSSGTFAFELAAGARLVLSERELRLRSRRLAPPAK